MKKKESLVRRLSVFLSYFIMAISSLAFFALFVFTMAALGTLLNVWVNETGCEYFPSMFAHCLQ